mmetsp:Transcript_60115/g.143257  ORF Transcript_60115/g.143257 Transcript_60115/m.143257 type:complete len:350 (+) Transcript_60115:93-1142(+)
MRRHGLPTVGDSVRVKCEMLTPHFGWGAVSPGDVGKVAIVEGIRCRVNFPKHLRWNGLLQELEVVMCEKDRALLGVMEMYEHLFNSRKFEDVTFELMDGREGAHKAVLSAASEAFAAMFEQPMQESQSGRVELTTVKRATMRVFLRLLYTGRVDPRDWEEENLMQVSCHSRSPDEPERSVMEDLEYKDAVDNDAHSVESGEHEETDDADMEDQNWPNGPAIISTEASVELSPTRIGHVIVPLETLCEVTGLAQKYMVNNVLELTVEALKVRVQKAAVEKNTAVFEQILSVAVKMGLGAVRTQAVQVAKTSKAIRRRYDAKQFHPEVQSELQAVWPPPRPALKTNTAWLA